MIVPFTAYLKPSTKTRGQIPAKVMRQLRERSMGVCERCCNELATEIVGQGTVEQMVHLCKSCRTYCEKRIDGQIFLKQFIQIKENAK